MSTLPEMTLPGDARVSVASPAHAPIRAGRMLGVLFAADAGIALLSVAVALMLRLRPDALFGEGMFVSVLSAMQIIAIACVSLWIFQMRAGEGETRLPRGLAGRADVAAASRAGYRLWLLASVGFLWLACDEALAIHEWIDHRIHHVLSLRESPWTDRLDDLIVLSYGVIGLSAMWRWRNELALFRRVRHLFIAAFALFFIMVGLDLLTNGYDVDISQLPQRARLEMLAGLSHVCEDTCKLMGESAFLAAFLAAAEVARRHAQDDRAHVSQT
jgi:hypothetical protein